MNELKRPKQKAKLSTQTIIGAIFEKQMIYSFRKCHCFFGVLVGFWNGLQLEQRPFAEANAKIVLFQDQIKYIFKFFICYNIHF